MSDDKLRALLRQIMKDNPGASDHRVHELFMAAMELEENKDASREAWEYFVRDGLRKQQN
jgi:hypothetical protein